MKDYYALLGVERNATLERIRERFLERPVLLGGEILPVVLPNYLVNDGCVLRSDLPEVLKRVKEVSDQYG